MATCVHLLQQKFDKFLASAPKKFDLQPYKSDKYFGLLLDDKTADWFKNMLCDFASEVSKLDIEVEPHKKQLHLTLAFKFLQEHRQILDQLSKKINYQAPANWEMRLYSRDPRLANSEVIYNY
ncbi:Protein UBASH3A-like protein isoform X1 [Oopsacas minuta]|uniref:Protein UBASH3A-like protein isoform X1 n=1 Tax=Oopsacas minuta TaxID=111878 RepID=A0AAV7K2M2_9METZ|nr:Protein UBASH3A-like protein isoform X1 [Oopsacas minuta]